MSPLANIVALPVRAYRLILSPWVGLACRYLPPALAGWDIVLIGRPATVDRAFPALVEDLSAAIRRLGVA
jgi:hypothetical protein